MMKLLPLVFLSTAAIAHAYYTITVYAPREPTIHDKEIHAREGTFIIGAGAPSTHCGLDDRRQCPDGLSTKVNENMTALAAMVPGGQSIHVENDGIVSYSPYGHTNYHPPGSKVGGFRMAHVVSQCSTDVWVFVWQPDDGVHGLWACGTEGRWPISHRAVLKAATVRFRGRGCLEVEGLKVHMSGDGFGAWAYD
ncbi:hypothetical protein F66182_6243 [Fusarium sp. NRRL 66182]|nr:hypothetical protein F66182_6243 [Fusarium sp. NRRL 66182]